MALRTLLTDPMLRMLAVAVALAIFIPVAGEAQELAAWISNAAVFVLFLLNGMRIARADILAALANWRFLLPLVLWVFGAMALAGLGLAHFGGYFLPPLVATGFLYLGILPSTVQSAASYTALAGGNIALSVVSAALLNILGVLLSVPIFLALGGTGDDSLGPVAILKVVLVLILPFAIGQMAQDRTQVFIARHKSKLAWVDRAVIAIAVYVAVSGAVAQEIGNRIESRDWAVLFALVAAMLSIAHGGAWMTAGVLGMSRADRVAFLFAGAQKSAAVGAPLATVIFAPEIAGFIVVPLLLYHLCQLAIAAPLAMRLAQNPG